MYDQHFSVTLQHHLANEATDCFIQILTQQFENHCPARRTQVSNQVSPYTSPTSKTPTKKEKKLTRSYRTRDITLIEQRVKDVITKTSSEVKKKRQLKAMMEYN